MKKQRLIVTDERPDAQDLPRAGRRPVLIPPGFRGDEDPYVHEE
jgi:hypothetical protein